MKEYNLDDLGKIVKATGSGGNVVWLTAPSGHGKSFIGATLDGMGVKTVHLDKYGSREEVDGGTRWVVNLPETVVKTHAIFEGHADNPKVVAKLLYQRAAGNQLTIMLVRANITLFRSIQAAKARDHKASAKQFVKAWYNGWTALSKITPSDFAKKWGAYTSDMIILVAAAVNELDPIDLFKDVAPLSARDKFHEWKKASGLVGRSSELLAALSSRKVEFRILNNVKEKVASSEVAGWHGESISHAAKEKGKEVDHGN